MVLIDDTEHTPHCHGNGDHVTSTSDTPVCDSDWPTYQYKCCEEAFNAGLEEEKERGWYYPATEVKEVAEGRYQWAGSKVEEEEECPTEEETQEIYKN